MKIRGRWLKAPQFILKEKKYLITLEVDVLPKIYESTKDKDISVEIEKWSDKRSGRANRYFHELVDEIAEAIKSSHTEVHNKMIADYGQMDTTLEYIILRDDIPWQKVDVMHLRPTTATRTLDDGKLYRVFHIMRGSHTYDTKEMARLIDGTVSEAKELGIETMPPEELERMIAAWQGKA